ncbi:MAG TPA: arginyltransferase [Geminicoccaceae bacterium]|nr:arginyltransferase [Geminicoccaceae bacterium]
MSGRSTAVAAMKLFYSTDPAPCPYLPGRMERRLVTFLDGDDGAGDARHDELLRAGFRRSHSAVYRPACPGCEACVPVRVPVARFAWTRTWRRVLRRNADLAALERPTGATAEQFELFRRYVGARHGDGGMSGMGWGDYRAMVEDSPASSRLVEFRTPEGRLIAVSLTDRVPSGLSGVYKFFEPDESRRRSLGSFAILWHVRRAAELGLPHVYLGYWIARSPKMAYKARFRPQERLTPDGWREIEAAPEEDGTPGRPDR